LIRDESLGDEKCIPKGPVIFDKDEDIIFIDSKDEDYRYDNQKPDHQHINRLHNPSLF
jgi:hypothetical protein